MPVRTSVKRQLSGMVTVGVLALLTGCGSSFFPPLTTGTGGGGGTTPTTTGDFVYVANATSFSITGFAVATTTAGAGTLTEISSSPYKLSLAPTALAVTPSNSFLYSSQLGGIYGFAIDGTTGALSALSSGSAIAITTYGAVSLDVSPDGKWLFALSQDSQTLDQYQINTSTGTIAIYATQTYTGAKGAQAVAKMVKISPTGAYVFLVLGTGGDVVVPFDSPSGTLNKIETSPKLSTGNTTTSDNAVAFDANTAFLYIARSGGSSGVAVYAIGAGGSLAPVTGSPFAAGSGPFGVALDSTGKYVYAANRTDGTISGYSIGTGAVLTALAGSPFTSGAGVTSLVADKSKTYLLAAAVNGSPDVTMYSFDAISLGSLNSAATIASGVDPAGSSLVVATH